MAFHPNAKSTKCGPSHHSGCGSLVRIGTLALGGMFGSAACKLAYLSKLSSFQSLFLKAEKFFSLGARGWGSFTQTKQRQVAHGRGPHMAAHGRDSATCMLSIDESIRGR